MTAVQLSRCAGLWRRTLLIEEDGSHVTGGDVRWLQGDAAYVDSRGFGGRLIQSDDVFEWHRMVDLEPPGPFPDAGVMHWDGAILVETGVHADYVEHWVRDDGPASPRWALTLRSTHGRRRRADSGRRGVRLGIGDRRHAGPCRRYRVGSVGAAQLFWR